MRSKTEITVNADNIRSILDVLRSYKHITINIYVQSIGDVTNSTLSGVNVKAIKSE